jgi:hypothetical protein
VRAYFDGTLLGCTFDNEAGDTGEVSTEADAELAGRGGVRVYNDRVDYHAFVLYR